MDTKDKLIEKLKEIFKYLNDRANTVTLNWSYYYDLRKEIDLLEQQVEEEEYKEHNIPPISFGDTDISSL